MKDSGSSWCAVIVASLRASVSSRMSLNRASLSGYLMKMSIAIKATIGLLPAVAALIAMIIFVKYPLTDARFKEIRDETEARKLAAIEAHHENPDDFITPDHKV